MLNFSLKLRHAKLNIGYNNVVDIHTYDTFAPFPCQTFYYSSFFTVMKKMNSLIFSHLFLLFLFGFQAVVFVEGCITLNPVSPSPAKAISPSEYRKENSLPPAQRRTTAASNETETTTSGVELSNLRHWGEDCGFSKYWKADGVNFGSSRIVGGTDALPNEFPHQVLLRFSGNICGGSIIHE